MCTFSEGYSTKSSIPQDVAFKRSWYEQGKGPQGESRNTRDRAGHIRIHRTSSEARTVRCPLRPTIHTQPGSRWSKWPHPTGQKRENWPLTHGRSGLCLHKCFWILFLSRHTQEMMTQVSAHTRPITGNGGKLCSTQLLHTIWCLWNPALQIVSLTH